MNKFPQCSAALTDLFTYRAKTIFSIVLGRKKQILQNCSTLNIQIVLRITNKIYLIYKL